jgi:hypothetical protein
LSVKKDFAQLRTELEAQGFEFIPRRRSTHLMIKAPNGIGMTSLSSTPSEYRSLKNLRAWARRNMRSN